jgi:penicillin amidase
MMRRLSQGRVAESIGSLGSEVDRFIRTIDLGRAVPGIAGALPEETRRWLQCFVRGLNQYIEHATTLPEEFRLFAFRREPWSIGDVLRLGRLVSADVNWIVWFRLLRLRGDADWPTLWYRLIHHDVLSPGTTQLADAAATVLKSGSNCFVVSPRRCARRAPLIASDPHLTITLPNPWIIAGMVSPSYHAVGLMIPGLPFVAAGRNTAIAWGGTNLHAASSDLVVAPSHAQTDIRQREETIAVRWRHPRKIRVRESRWDPS